MHTAPRHLLLCALLLLLFTGCEGTGFGFPSEVEFQNLSGFTVEVSVDQTLKLSSLPNGGIGTFTSSTGFRPLRVRDRSTGLLVLAADYRFRSDVLNRIRIEESRAILRITQAGTCCQRIFIDGRQMMELGGGSSRDLLIPAGSWSIEVRSCAGVTQQTLERILLPGQTVTVDLAASLCP